MNLYNDRLDGYFNCTAFSLPCLCINYLFFFLHLNSSSFVFHFWYLHFFFFNCIFMFLIFQNNYLFGCNLVCKFILFRFKRMKIIIVSIITMHSRSIFLLLFSCCSGVTLVNARKQFNTFNTTQTSMIRPWSSMIAYLVFQARRK